MTLPVSDTAITLRRVKKKFCLYKRNVYRVIEALFPVKRQYHTPFMALNGVDLQVRRGETVGIIGRNGSGKSTLLQVICGILQPTEGEVAVAGRISALLELGAGFNPEFNGRDNIYLSTSIMGLSKQETDQRFQRIVDFADIGEFIDQPVKMYSSGMFVRLAFATAISIDPDILIVDEALAVGDIFFQQKCMNNMKQMMATKTIVLVSHDMQAVSSLCDRVIVMEKGEKIFDGATAEGIALYTRLVHDELFEQEEHKVANGIDIPPAVGQRLMQLEADFARWLPVADSSRGGGGAVSILRVSMTKDGAIFKTVEPGERITVRMLVYAQRPLAQVIFAYTVKDRTGLAIFGENSLATLDTPPSLAAGFSLVRCELEWPEILSQEYTMTLGIGEGDHPFDHTIQCWAHNVFSLTAMTPGRYVHGIFNNRLRSVAIKEISGAAENSARRN
jgi:ABC-type polysaccharide/polyol phosphate transport system ATPase subunit